MGGQSDGSGFFNGGHCSGSDAEKIPASPSVQRGDFALCEGFGIETKIIHSPKPLTAPIDGGSQSQDTAGAGHRVDRTGSNEGPVGKELNSSVLKTGGDMNPVRVLPVTGHITGEI